MGCPYLTEGKVNRVCVASSTLMEPESGEVDIYCATEDHYRCPMLLAHVLRGGDVSGQRRLN